MFAIAVLAETYRPSASIEHKLKGPIPSILVVHFTSINQKPMIPRTHFHCITTWVARSSG